MDVSRYGQLSSSDVKFKVIEIYLVQCAAAYLQRHVFVCSC